MSNHESEGGFEIKFTDREVSAWGGMALMKRMLDQMGFQQAACGWDLPPPGSNRGYPPVQLIEQWVVSIWCGACRFAHAETVRFDGTLTRLFGWTKVAGHRAIVRLFERFDRARNEAVQEAVYRWFFDKVSTLMRITLDMDSTVITRHGAQEGATRGYNPGKRGRPSHHPLLAFVAEARMIANFWFRLSHLAAILFVAADALDLAWLVGPIRKYYTIKSSNTYSGEQAWLRPLPVKDRLRFPRRSVMPLG